MAKKTAPKKKAQRIPTATCVIKIPPDEEDCTGPETTPEDAAEAERNALDLSVFEEVLKQGGTVTLQ